VQDYARLPQGADLAAPAPPPQAIAVQTTIESAGSGPVTYRVARPVAVPSDGSPHKTTVTIEKLGVKLDYVTAPKLAQEAYLRATITNTSEYTLLPGEASIFHGDTFVGKTRIETVAPTEEFKAQLGVDDRVRVKRELVKRDVGRKLVGSTRRTQFAYKITVTSHLSRTAKITAYDQIRWHETSRSSWRRPMKPGEQSEMNILKWEIEVQPGSARSSSASWSTPQHECARTRMILTVTTSALNAASSIIV
jgi:uncharacterized protein (TIGR02231 family)